MPTWFAVATGGRGMVAGLRSGFRPGEREGEAEEDMVRLVGELVATVEERERREGGVLGRGQVGDQGRKAVGRALYREPEGLQEGWKED